MLYKTIHLDHSDNNLNPHVHDGDNYHHESGKSRGLTEEELQVTNTVLTAWKERGTSNDK